MITIEMGQVLEFLTAVLETPSPVGYHSQVIGLIEGAVRALSLPGLALARTRKGALVVTVPGREQGEPRALSAHVDTLGAMVREVKANGRLLLTQLGGYAWNSVEGENVTIHCLRDGATYRGTVQTVNPSVHTSRQVSEGKREEERMEVRLDARTASKEETLALGIDVGDIVSFDPRVEMTDTGFIKSRHLDDKAGVAVLYGVLLTLQQEGRQPAHRTTFLFSNYEEVGHGAVGLPDDTAELLVVDMAASTTGEHQNSDEYSVGICAKDSGTGPYDIEMRRRLVALCEEYGIPYRVDIYPYYGSDGSFYLKMGADARVGLIGPGLDASHGYERTHRDSIEAAVRLAVHYVLDA
ncbi:MAG TPA: M42 family metallopeptidase [Chloroflexi bacterium]|jgi:putative aminopeptidase FrvX|nr:M42 family metallopeptidase [Chloroflexota bacterium]